MTNDVSCSSSADTFSLTLIFVFYSLWTTRFSRLLILLLRVEKSSINWSNLLESLMVLVRIGFAGSLKSLFFALEGIKFCRRGGSVMLVSICLKESRNCWMESLYWSYFLCWVMIFYWLLDCKYSSLIQLISSSSRS